MATWYYMANQTDRVGPIDDRAMQTAVQSGKIMPSTLVFKAGETEWKLARDFPELVAMHKRVSSILASLTPVTEPKSDSAPELNHARRPDEDAFPKITTSDAGRLPEDVSAESKRAFGYSAQMADPKTANKSKRAQSKPYTGLKFYHWISFAFPMVACVFLGVTSNPEFGWGLLLYWMLLLFPPTSFFHYFTFFSFLPWGVRGESIVAFAGAFHFLITVTGTIGLCILFRKSGIPKYNVFIPIVGIDRLFHTVGLSRWYFILLYIPLIGSILGFVCVLKLIKLTTKEKGLSSFLSLLFTTVAS